MVAFLILTAISTWCTASPAMLETFDDSSIQGEKSADADTVKAVKGPFEVTLELDGAFDSPGALEVLYRPEAYTGELKVSESVEPGPVIKGQCLVRFETDSIDQRIEQAEIDLTIARTSLQKLQEESKRKEEAKAIELKGAEMNAKNAEQTLKTFKDVLMPMRFQEAELGLKSSQDRLEEEEEQYVQLEKMYKSDDLVEETEEIVMRRARRGLEQSKTRMTFTLRRHELTKTIDIPRELRGYEFSLRAATNSWELSKSTAALQLEQGEIELKKAVLALERQESELEKLKRDRESLTIVAPETAVAVPGQLVRGKWQRLEENARSLRPGEKCSPNQVLFTLVEKGPRVVSTAVPEVSVLDVTIGQTAVVSPSADSKTSLSAVVRSVARVSSNGLFDTWLEISEPDLRLLAGHTCKVKLTTSRLENAITVPSSALSKDGDQQLVHVWKNGEASPRHVNIGAASEGRTVILSGLSEGEEILSAPPAAKTP